VGVSEGEDLVSAVEPSLPDAAEVVRTNRILRYVSVSIPRRASKRAKEQFARELAAKPGIKYVEPPEEIRITPAHVGAKRTETRPDDQYAPQAVGAPGAWEVTTGDPSINVGVVDTGVKYDHPDLETQMNGAIPNAGHDDVDDDSDPYPEDLDPDDGEYHGTHVAGIVAADRSRSAGTAGIADVSLVNSRALDTEAYGSSEDIADGIAWQGAIGVDVINASLSLFGPSNTVQSAVKKAYEAGSVIVTSAGNDGESVLPAPARYPETIAVSALDRDGSLASYSNYSAAGRVDVAAPGTDVLSTWIDDDYRTLSGTSMAAPVVSGVAALALDQFDFDGPGEVKRHLKATADDVGLRPQETGAGRIDAKAAVAAQTTFDRETTVVEESLAAGERQCWGWSQKFDRTAKLEIELEGPENADFDLHAALGNRCPVERNGQWNSDFSSTTPRGDEVLVVERPFKTAEVINATVVSWQGAGDYLLRITEYGR